ncbi:MAG: DNA polymerase III subunit beta [Acidiferrobacter sp.]
MQFTLVKEELVRQLSAVAGVVERRQTKPILSNILVEAQDGTVRFTGTDLEIEMVTWGTAAVGTPGAVTVPGRKFLDIVRALPAHAEVRAHQEEGRLRIVAGRSRFALSTLPAEDFPRFEATNWESQLTLPRAVLRRLIEKTQFCMAQQDVRYYLNGLMFETLPGSIKAVAADGHRLALCEEPLTGEDVTEKQIIVPRKGVQEMVRLLSNDEGSVALKIGTNHVQLEAAGLIFTSKLIDGRFPDYNRVVPAGVQKTVVMPREPLREMLSRVGIVSTEKYRSVRLRFTGEMVVASAHNPEQDEASEELLLSTPVSDFEIGFNVGYLIEAVGAIDGNEVEFGWNSADSGCWLKAPQSAQRVLYVVMPMRL